jgi:transposase
MVDLTRRCARQRHRARLLDLVPGRSGRPTRTWLTDARGRRFRSGCQVATLDPFHGYKNAIDDQLEDARAVLDAFHVVKFATAVDDVRRRVQQDIHGHRGRKATRCTGSGTSCAPDTRTSPTDNKPGLTPPSPLDVEHVEVELAYRCAQQVRAVYHQTTLTAAGAIAETVIDSLPGCPVPEVARLGRTLKQWASEFLGYFDTNRASNGGTEATNGLIELHRRIARGFRNRDNYRLRMLLIAGGLDKSPHTQR